MLSQDAPSAKCDADYQSKNSKAEIIRMQGQGQKGVNKYAILPMKVATYKTVQGCQERMA